MNKTSTAVYYSNYSYQGNGYCFVGELIKRWGRVPFLPGQSHPPLKVGTFSKMSSISDRTHQWQGRSNSCQQASLTIIVLLIKSSLHVWLKCQSAAPG